MIEVSSKSSYTTYIFEVHKKNIIYQKRAIIFL